MSIGITIQDSAFKHRTCQNKHNIDGRFKIITAGEQSHLICDACGHIATKNKVTQQ